MVGDNDDKTIDVQEMNLEEWLNLVFSSKNEECFFIDYMFPNDSLKEKYLGTIQNRDEKEVINLLRKFLIQSGTTIQEELRLNYLLNCGKDDKEQFKKLINIEFYKRVLMHSIDKNYHVWEGNTWIIDLLPHNPKLAIAAIEAYFIAHIQFLPDGRFNSFSDAKSLIRAKFIDYKHPEEILLGLDPYDFEYLISALYRKMNYETNVTKKARDGGVDILAKKESIGEKEKLLIQCKRWESKVGEPDVMKLLGAISHAKANRGILVTTSDFSKPAKDFSSENNIELINRSKLNELLNDNFGPKWDFHLDYIITEEKCKNSNE